MFMVRKRMEKILSFKNSSIRRRLINVALISIIAWGITLSLFYRYVFDVLEGSNVSGIIKTDLEQIVDEMENKYSVLVTLTQQMIPEGNIGSDLDTYLNAEDIFDKYEKSDSITEKINLMLFSHPEVSAIGYIQLNDSDKPVKNLFTNMPLEELDPRNLDNVTGTEALSFQSVHTCMNVLSNRKVISIYRPINVSNHRFLIYTEIFTDIENEIEKLNDNRKLEYTWLQINESGNINYSNKNIEIDTLDFSDLNSAQIIQHGNYYILCKESNFGFYYAFAVPKNAYLKQEYYWHINLVLMILAGILTVSILTFLFFHFIYKPFNLLGHEMIKASEGDLEPVTYNFNIIEFDHLFEEFNQMKLNVIQMMEDVRRSEREKQQLEIDKLYYQINPHFLMNALHSLHWMAVVNEQEDIDEYIYQLNFILGYSLGKIYTQSTFRTEIKSLEMYVDLQKKRYDFNFWLETDIEQYLDEPCARLILQPLAENAICHNMDSFGNLWVSMYTENDNIIIEIRDDGLGIKNKEDIEKEITGRQNKGIGLRYVKLSLQAFYGENVPLILKSFPDKGTQVIIKIPIGEGNGS